MKSSLLQRFLFAAALALPVFVSAQTLQFRATINGAQEVPASGSAAAGSAVMIYDVGTNKYDLVVTLTNFPSTLLSSQIEEGAAGTAGTGVSSLGGEVAYTRSGNTLTATFRNQTYGGTKLTLIKNGAALNFATGAFMNGEIRGQLIAQPKRLYANIDVPQERAAFPANANLASAAGFGAAVMTYDPGLNKVNLRISVFNYNNTLTNSHYHEQAPGASGPVVTNLGAGTVANYAITGNQINGTFLNLTYAGDPIKLLTGGAYLNFHSNVNGAGECRGQVFASEEQAGSRLLNLSALGNVAAGGSLVGGLNVAGPEPVRVLVTAKGPSLTALGVAGALANPSLAIYDSAGRRIAANEDVGALAGTELADIYGVPTNTVESALVLVLPPGSYTAVVTGGSGSGTALLEAYDLRNQASVNAGATGTVAEFDADTKLIEEFHADLKLATEIPRFAARTLKLTPKELELCGAPAAPAKRTTNSPLALILP
jgi:hypothetical protein